MKLSQLLAACNIHIDSDCDVLALQNDSRQVQTGALFLAYPGAALDGRLFIEKAVSAGAVAILYEPLNLTVSLPDTIPCIPFPDLAHSLGILAQHFYHNPTQSLDVTGVTGTNGKTTIAYQLAQAHQLLGCNAAYLGTIGQGRVDQLEPLLNTTPDALLLQKLMAQYVSQGVKSVCMEVSSHALNQHRVDGIRFQQAIYTNLTLDHLDYHHTMQEYAAAKALLFARPELESAIINHDDAYQQIMSQSLLPHVKTVRYGLNAGAEVRAISWQMGLEGTEIEVQSPWGTCSIKIQALGQFNIYNSLAIFASLMVQGYALDSVVKIMGQLKAAPGRMEIVSQSPCVLVDYAHTPDALQNALMTLNEIKKRKLWVVFGCGGDRDKTKRPLMGKIASDYADHTVITSDNPRTEEPQAIVDDIVKGLDNSKMVTSILNRQEAITQALAMAHQDDIVLIAGKGHESYQQIGTVKHHFSDQEVVRDLIKGR